MNYYEFAELTMRKLGAIIKSGIPQGWILGPHFLYFFEFTEERAINCISAITAVHLSNINIPIYEMGRSAQKAEGGKHFLGELIFFRIRGWGGGLWDNRKGRGSKNIWGEGE